MPADNYGQRKIAIIAILERFTMILYHTTLKSRLDSILLHGLCPDYSQGKLKVNWLCTQSKRLWSLLHVQKRHNCTLDEIAVITLSIPRSKLTRRWRGLWTTDCTIDATAFVSITDAEAYTASPIKNGILDTEENE